MKLVRGLVICVEAGIKICLSMDVRSHDQESNRITYFSSDVLLLSPG